MAGHNNYCDTIKENDVLVIRSSITELLNRPKQSFTYQDRHMLVLTRREGEKIMIGDSIAITVVRMGGDKVRLGIEAPNDMLILRGELEVHNDGRRVISQESVTQNLAKPAA